MAEATAKEVWSYEKTKDFIIAKHDATDMSEHQYNFLLQQFQTEDTNNDFHIDRHELHDVLESISDDDYTEEDIITIMNEYDLDHNGTIEFHEFAHMVLTHTRFTMIRKALANIDREHRNYESRKRRKSSLLALDPERVASNHEPESKTSSPELENQDQDNGMLATDETIQLQKRDSVKK